MTYRLRHVLFFLTPFVFSLFFSSSPFASEEYKPYVTEESWSFAGPFGQYDKAQLQRGLKVYREVCAACHGLEYVSFRSLAEEGGPGFTPEQAKAIAQDYLVTDGPDETGEMFERAGRVSDRFPSPYPNEEAARASNAGAYPPDLSLMAKARAAHRGFPQFVIDPFTLYQENGPDYIYSLLAGYKTAPPDVKIDPGLYYNPSFIPGAQIAMPPPLSDGIVSYPDDSPETVDQYARDVSAFLMWAAEPKLEARKKIGFRVVVFLVVLAVLLYFVNRRVWSPIKGKTK